LPLVGVDYYGVCSELPQGIALVVKLNKLVEELYKEE